MCAICGQAGKYGQHQAEAIRKDKEKLKRVRATREKRAKAVK